MYLDSHCHLNHERSVGSDCPADIVARAKTAGVAGMVNICTNISKEFSTVLSTARDHENVWCSVGTHPHDAADPDDAALNVEDIVRLAESDPKVVGIGETGLDYYYNHAPPEAQQKSFRKHIRACIATGLPLIVHARDADEDIIKIIREEGGWTGYGDEKLTGIMHCFSSSPLLAEKALEGGFFLSFSGMVTFKKSNELREIVKTTPVERILIETDAPFLAPEPYRGQANEPAFIINTAQMVCEIKKLDEEQFLSICKNNFFSVFKKAEKTFREIKMS